MAAEAKLRTLRGIVREMRKLYQSKSSTRTLFGYSYLMSEYRHSRTVDDQTTRALNRDAENYLSLLRSERMKEELREYYKGAGEVKVEDVARRVGFKMPKLYDENQQRNTADDKS